MLTAKWATNKASGSSITLSHTKEKVFDGKYALKFEYKETTSGWAGATISKEVDWSDCDTLSFYVIPDGKNQKTVVQLTANGNVYETYLNLYEEYSNAKAGTPLKVNIPFSDFCQRDTAGNPKGGLVEDSKAITSFGLWVNAIEDSEAVENGYVSGTLIYDKITAEKTGIDKAAFEIIKGFDDKADAADSNQANTSNEDSKVNDNNNLDKTEISKAADEQQIEDATVPATGKAGFNKVFILVGAVIAILAIAVVGIIRWKRM